MREWNTSTRLNVIISPGMTHCMHQSAQASIAAPLRLSSIPSSLWEILGDIKKVSYRLGWLDGQSDLRKKFIENLKQQYTKKEGDYNETAHETLPPSELEEHTDRQDD